MAKSKAVIEHAPDMLLEPEKYFDVELNHDERLELKQKIIQVAGIKPRAFYWQLEEPTEDEIVAVLNRNRWGTYDNMYTYILIKLARDLGIDHHSFAKCEPKRSIDSFVELATTTLTDFVPSSNSTIAKLQESRLRALFSDWLDTECPRHGCAKQGGHTWCADRFVPPNLEAIIAMIAASNKKRRRIVKRDIEKPSAAGVARLRLVYSAD